MIQRLVVGGAIASTVVCAALLFLIGSLIQDQRRGNLAMLEQIAKLVSVKTDPPPQALPEKRLDQLKIKVTIGAGDGPPARGYEVTVSKVPQIGDVVAQEGFVEEPTHGQNRSKETIRKQLNAKTDANGFVDCGFVEPGVYSFSVETPWNESVNSTLTFHPGTDHVEHVIAPDKMPELTDVNLTLEGLPDDLDEKRFALVMSFHPIGSRVFEGRPWYRGGAWFFGETMPFVMIVPRHGVWISQIDWRSGNTRWPDTVFRPGRNATTKWERLEPPYHFQIPAHEYSVLFDFVRAPANDAPSEPGWPQNLLYDMNDSMLEWTEGSLSHDSDPKIVKMTAFVGQSNDWKIAVPRPVVKGWKKRPGKSSEQNQYPAGQDPFERQVGSMFPFGIRQPSMIRDLRNSGLRGSLSLSFSKEQSLMLHEIDARRREYFINHPPNEDVGPDDIENWRSRFMEFEQEFADVLTPEQKANWVSRMNRTAEEWAERQKNVFELKHEMLNQAFVHRLDLTDDQTYRLRELKSRSNRNNNRRNRQVESEQTEKEAETGIEAVLTPDQRAVWEQRKSELRQELATFEKTQAAVDAIAEAKAIFVDAPQPRAGTGGRPRVDPQNASAPVSDQVRIQQLQEQLESLKQQIESLKATATPPK